MKSLYESILKTNNASIENDLIEWCESKFHFKDLPMYCEKYKDGYSIIIDSFEHQPQIQGINLTEAPPKYLRGIYYMKYENRQSEGVKTPLELRYANVRFNTLDLSKWHFEQVQSLWTRNIFQILASNIKEIMGLPSTNHEMTYYNISLSNIESIHNCNCPNVTLYMHDCNSINPFNIYKCEFKRLIISDLILDIGTSQMLRDKVFGSSTFDDEEYIRHGNIYQLNRYYQKIIEHLLTKNKIDTLQVWARPSKSNKNELYYIIKNPKYGYCLKR